MLTKTKSLIPYTSLLVLGGAAGLLSQLKTMEVPEPSLRAGQEQRAVTQLPAEMQVFASVSVKPSVSSTPGTSRLQVLPNGDLLGRAVSVADLISLAYAVPINPSPRLASLPEWTVRRPFDIEVKNSASLELDRKDIETQRRIIALLLQKLLSERFRLQLRMRTASVPVYTLVLSGTSHELTTSTVSPKDCILDTGPDGCHSFAIGFGHPLDARGVDMSDLALYLENWTDLPVVDRTARTGLYAMHSQGWRPMNLPPPPPGASAAGTEFAGLLTLSSVLDGLGLQLHREEASLPFYTVDRIDQPDPR